MLKRLKAIPKFNNESEEADFWASHDSAEYFDYSKPVLARFANLKPSSKAVTIRMPEYLIEELKILANKKDVPYQSLMKVFVSERIERELYKA